MKAQLLFALVVLAFSATGASPRTAKTVDMEVLAIQPGSATVRINGDIQRLSRNSKVQMGYGKGKVTSDGALLSFYPEDLTYIKGTSADLRCWSTPKGCINLKGKIVDFSKAEKTGEVVFNSKRLVTY